MYIYIYIHTHTDIYRHGAGSKKDRSESDRQDIDRFAAGSIYPQLRFIHIHQLFRIQYTLFRLDTVNIYWWWCIKLCRVI